MARFSVVIPAHNESAVIARCLGAILEGAPEGEPEIIVVANGCTDKTAEEARRFADRVQVIELGEGSKPLALNTGARAASSWPRFFVDADIEVSYASLAAAAVPLRDAAPRASAPAPHIDLRSADSLVRLYYSIWKRLPYLRDGLVGAGVYGLNEAGFARIGTFPDIIGDDLYVRELFARSERFSIKTNAAGAPARFTIFPPRRLESLIHIETRRLTAYDEMRSLLGRGPSSHPAHRAALLRLMLKPWHWPGLAVYTYVKLESRRRYRAQKQAGTSGRWLRDDSSRVSER